MSGMTEKSALVEKAQELDDARVTHEVPAGFALDPNSGYFCNIETGMYFDAQSGCYYKDGKWLRRDAAGFVEIPVHAGENGASTHA